MEKPKPHSNLDPATEIINCLIESTDELWVNLPALAKNLINQAVDYCFDPVESYRQSQIYQLLESIYWFQKRELVVGLECQRLSYISQFYGHLHRLWQDNQQRLAADFRPRNHDLKISLPRLRRVFRINYLISDLAQLEDRERSSLVTSQNQFWYHLSSQADQSPLEQLVTGQLQALNKHYHFVYGLNFEGPTLVYDLDNQQLSSIL